MAQQAETEVFSMNRMRKKWASGRKSADGTTLKVAAQRKQDEADIRKVVDGRSLRKTGRTAQFNFRARDDLKKAAQEAAKADGISLAEWMEAAIEAALSGKDVGNA